MRFTNAHETLLWVQKEKGAPYTFNHHAMKALNGEKQMRSDWVIPICNGSERLKVNGEKAHSTQKPEALLYRVIQSTTNPGDVVLDPFFGSGTTGAVAKRLHRHWIGIEREEAYVELARERIVSIKADAFEEETYVTPDPRKQPRVPFGKLLESGLVAPGQKLYLGEKGRDTATVLADGAIKVNGTRGSIHQVAKQILDAPANGWEVWFYKEKGKRKRKSINALRQQYREEFLA